MALAICAVAGYWLARLFRFPALFMSGALIVSAAAHVTGAMEARPPGLVIAFAQLGIDVVSVASHQLIRIMFVVLMAPVMAKLLRGGRKPPADAP